MSTKNVVDKFIIDQLKKLRQHKKIAFEFPEKMREFSMGYISRIENSDSASPIPTWVRIAQALETDTSFSQKFKVKAHRVG